MADTLRLAEELVSTATTVRQLGGGRGRGGYSGASGAAAAETPLANRGGMLAWCRW